MTTDNCYNGAFHDISLFSSSTSKESLAMRAQTSLVQFATSSHSTTACQDTTTTTSKCFDTFHPSILTPMAPDKPPGIIPTLIPPAWLPYAQLMRLDRPWGVLAFYVPYLAGLCMASCMSPTTISPSVLAKSSIMLLGWSVLNRGWQCAWNDNVDQEFDRQVARCRSRPIARGAVSTAQAHVFTASLYALSCAYLWYFTRTFSSSFATGTLGTATFISHEGMLSTHDQRRLLAFDVLIASVPALIYPLGKRFTNYPQLILGVLFSLAIPMAAHLVRVDPFATTQRTSATLCACGVNTLWTMTYDTIYAHQDVADDVQAGVRSMAVQFRDSTKLLCAALSVGQVGLLVKAGWDMALGEWYFVVACAGTAVALGAMVWLVDLKRPESCAWWFKMDFLFVGATVCGGWFAEYVVARMAADREI